MDNIADHQKSKQETFVSPTEMALFYSIPVALMTISLSGIDASTLTNRIYISVAGIAVGVLVFSIISTILQRIDKRYEMLENKMEELNKS